MTPHPHKHVARDLEASPDEREICRALEHSDPSRGGTGNCAPYCFFSNTITGTDNDTATVITDVGRFVPVPVRDWADLAKGHEPLCINYRDDGYHAQFQVDKSKVNIIGRGSFKVCRPAMLTLWEVPMQWAHLGKVQLFHIGVQTPVVSKCHFIRASKNGPLQDAPIARENRFLEGEANLLYHATALHEHSERFVVEYKEANPSSAACRLDIPEMRMVFGRLFQHSKDCGKGRAGLVTFIEELIEKDAADDSDPGFIKFINNSSPVPVYTTGRAGRVATYLSFLQHVQYEKMSRQAFVSDYQGSLTKLSDPQILSHPEMGAIFGDGNVPEAFFAFETEHPCNEDCTAFGLSTFKRTKKTTQQVNKHNSFELMGDQSPSPPPLQTVLNDECAKITAVQGHAMSAAPGTKKQGPAAKGYSVLPTAEGRLQEEQALAVRRQSERLQQAAALKSQSGKGGRSKSCV
ncbi:hypothetical protein CALCODRAFT_506911 [Calocera cornea HHB12733]|uniref:Alpha-type protein kinase domain-containing protein n=1 Tax=Calocera cornea HHB12733 TaxID=1353952 RepID=A0A165I7Y3_9BASI|nr:hypothetical protein CALCODRAFT_506911 [Calocera cornea HHB12733]